MASRVRVSGVTEMTGVVITSPACMMPSRARYCRRSMIRIGRGAQAVADEVEGEDDDDHRDHRRQHPGVEIDRGEVLSVVEEHAPADDRRPQAEPEEGQRRL